MILSVLMYRLCWFPVHQKQPQPKLRLGLLFFWCPAVHRTQRVQYARAWVRICHSEIGELAHQAKSVQIFATGEIPVFFTRSPAEPLVRSNKKRNYESGSVFCFISTVIGGRGGVKKGITRGFLCLSVGGCSIALVNINGVNSQPIK